MVNKSINNIPIPLEEVKGPYLFDGIALADIHPFFLNSLPEAKELRCDLTKYFKTAI
jgi:hypothetical protein